jgi:phi13 family phage major tail protein
MIDQNATEYLTRIGLDSLYVAAVTQDDPSGYTAGTPQYMAPSAEAVQEPQAASQIEYADNAPFDALYAEGETKITLTLTGVSVPMLAFITGRVFDSSSGRMYDNGGIPPFVALLFRSKKSNGSQRYYCFLKGRFMMPKEDAATQKDKPDPKTVQLIFSALKTTYKFVLSGSVTDGVKRIVGDEDTTGFDATGFFSQVQTPVSTSPSSLTLSSSTPANNATGVLTTAAPALTFSNALANSSLSGVTLIKNSDGSVITATKSLDNTKKILTVTPGSSLGAATKYNLIASVTDIYGQALAATVTFTTA